MTYTRFPVLLLFLSAALLAACSASESARQPVDTRPAEAILAEAAPPGTVAPPDTLEMAPADTLRTAEPEPRPRRRGAPRIEEVYGPREVQVGDTPTYRVRLAAGAVLPVQYFWDFGEGMAAIGSTVTPGFPEEGHYMIRVTARNQLGADSAVVRVAAQPPMPPMPRAAAQGVLPPGTAYAWVVASRLEADEAQAAADRLRQAGFDVVVRPHASRALEEKAFVAVGAHRTEAEALAARAAVEQYADGPLWLARIDTTR
jgi:hypothetical protein